MPMFSADELTKIETRIADVETRTAAEIVVVTVPASDGYGDVRLGAAVALSLVLVTGLHLAWPALSVAWLLSLELAFILFGFTLCSVPSVLRPLLPAFRVKDAVERAAQLAFFQHAVFATRDRTGVVILLSELEHRVAILGDEAIHARVHDTGWSELVATLVRAIREGRAAQGVCEVIDRLGAELSQIAPVRSDDVNELSNKVRQDSSQ